MPDLTLQQLRVEVAARLRRARRDIVISQRELAQLASVSPTTVARLELGQPTRMGSLLAVLSAAGVDLLNGRPHTATVEEGATPASESTDRGGRRYPAHLPVRTTARFGSWWGDERYAPRVPQRPDVSFDLRPVPDRRSRWDADREGRQQRMRARARRQRELDELRAAEGARPW